LRCLSLYSVSRVPFEPATGVIEADRHEARLRAMPPETLPAVDVLIPTYNEPLDVIEKTIVGALSIDYPNFAVWVLDDGRRSWLKAFCVEKGVGYITAPDNKHAKAGNINHALTKTSAEYFAIFDADFVPQRNFLMRTLGFFQDSILESSRSRMPFTITIPCK
jgi:cellulose synthase (UDP-forming)